MPLHLLGKKSWNVYNADNIARVRRDEAAAAAKEAAAEQQMQEEDARRRIALLRGEAVSEEVASLEPAVSEVGPISAPDHSTSREPSSKRRRLRGEDDTDRDIRIAREDHSARATAAATNRIHRTSDAPLVDARGHIALFPHSSPPKRTEKEKKRETKPHATATRRDGMAMTQEGQGMRFADAAGFKKDVGAAPWYSSSNERRVEEPSERGDGVDVWGNADPRRHERDSSRMAASDPLLAIQRGVQGVRRAEREKKRWREERGREVEELIREEKREVKEREREERRNERTEKKHRSRRREGEEKQTAEERRERKSRHREKHRDDEERSRTKRGEEDREGRRHHRHEHRNSEDGDSLEGFRLDDEARGDPQHHNSNNNSKHGGPRRHRSRRSRSRSRDRERDRRPREQAKA